jgi:hypothetical protein
LPSYDKAVTFLGRECRSVVAGIKGKGIIHNKNFYWITNNPSESLNSEIDSYLAKFQYDLESLESANMFAKSKVSCQQNSTFSTICVRILLIKRLLFSEIKVTDSKNQHIYK